MAIFITADTHFGHENILKLCNRPFRTIVEHDHTLINNWNSCVAPRDMVYHLGDFCWGTPNRFINQLNGHIHIQLGNHDDPRLLSYSIFRVLPPIYNLRFNRQKIVLCHYPIENWDGMHKGSYHFHGHSHGRTRPLPGRLDVGVDCTGYKPILIQEAIRKLSEPIPDGLPSPSELLT